MQFHRTGTDPTREALLVCRNARWNVLVLLAIFWAIPVFWWYVAAPWWVTALCASLPALLTWTFLGIWRRRGRADNWVLALYRDGIWLNLRDCDYFESEPAETVVFVPYGEIVAARRYVHRYTTPSSDGDTSHRDVYLEMELKSRNFDELRAAIDDERRRDPPPRSYFGGFVTSRNKRSQSPIELEGDRALRVKFTMTNYMLRPSLKKVLATMQAFVAVDADQAPVRDEWEKMDGSEFNELVSRLVRNGSRIDAIALLRSRKGMSTTEASQFLDRLSEYPAETEKLPQPR